MFYTGIVLYNPDMNRLKDNIKSIINQVNYIICVDNNSKNIDEITSVFKQNNRIILIKNNSNMGIAYALNQIVEWGYENNFKWVLLLDQDSIPPKNIIIEYSKYISMNNIGIISPVIKDINLSNSNKPLSSYTIINNCQNVITSGCLVNIQVCKLIGTFNEKLFIDFVDIEFNKRMLINGYKIIRVNNVKLIHEVGHIHKYGLFICTNHNAFRRYYMVRNRLYFKYKYCGQVDFIISYIRLILGTCKILIFEQDKISKLKATIGGFKDYKKLL
ncbi:glycosyltransferase family 2 protein [Clostridium tyrobutyricum]|uniref:glycosyltransferase family 2 protein n=1 Tax=Clostridium tyrobutyricum TaxID=1519 RepID=UPI001C3D4741|nr:glycosyltransferase family 2 protein [Clostridium tyrobutyricum]MBV4438483.1 glycosyltransferase family 2 protein [Clostridium tyrobutyricum]